MTINITAYSLRFCLSLLVIFSLVQFIELNITELQNKNPERKLISGIMKICLSSEPDGTALVEDTFTRDEVLIVFKVDHFWLIDTNQLYAYLNSYDDSAPGTALVSEKTQIQTSGIWPKFPISPHSAVSFSGHDIKSSFYNQVLVFKDSDLFRYRVKTFNYAKRNLEIDLIGVHSTARWPALPKMRDVQYLSIPRDTRILVAPRIFVIPSIFLRAFTVFVLNPHNLDYPIEYEIHEFGLPGGPIDEVHLKFHHMLSNGKTIVFSTTGDICFDKICRRFSKIIPCGPVLEAFADSFAYWLWQNSDFTIRLLIIGLSSIMIVNLILSIFFIINQVNRIKDLT